MLSFHHLSKLTLLVIFCFSNIFAQVVWETVSNLPGGVAGTQVVSDPFDVNTRYCISQNGEGIFETSDLGQTWHKIGLEGILITDMLVYDGYLIVSSSDGIYRSEDGGASWQHYFEGHSVTCLEDYASDEEFPQGFYVGTMNGEVYGTLLESSDLVLSQVGTAVGNHPITDIDYYVGAAFESDLAVSTFDAGVWYYEWGQDWVQSNEGLTELQIPKIKSDSKGNNFAISNPNIMSTSFYNLPWAKEYELWYASDLEVTKDDIVFASSMGDGVWKKDPLTLAWSNYSEGLPTVGDGFIDIADIDLGPDNNLWAIYFSFGSSAKNSSTAASSDVIHGIYKTINPVTSIEGKSELPINYSLSQNYPNPFNPSTTINYSIPKQNYVTLKVFDVLGRDIETLIKKEQPQGNYKVDFDASRLTSGVYFYRLQVGDFIETKKMVLMK